MIQIVAATGPTEVVILIVLVLILLASIGSRTLAVRATRKSLWLRAGRALAPLDQIAPPGCILGAFGFAVIVVGAIAFFTARSAQGAGAGLLVGIVGVFFLLAGAIRFGVRGDRTGLRSGRAERE